MADLTRFGVKWNGSVGGVTWDNVPLLTPAEDGYWTPWHEAEAEITRLREAQGWQPIETAPKDGTPVLAWDEGAVCIVTWVSGDSVDPDGWYDVQRLDPAPTHWQPLPPAPVEVNRG